MKINHEIGYITRSHEIKFASKYSWNWETTIELGMLQTLITSENLKLVYKSAKVRYIYY